MISSLILAVCLGLVVPGGFDLNTATLQELQELDGLDSQQASDLYTFIYETGGLLSIYDIMEIPGFGAEELEYLKNICVVVPPSDGRISPDIISIMERLATEDGPGDAAVDMWENYLLRPIPINSATSWQLRSLDRVSLIDAAAVERRLNTLGPVSSVYSLRNADDLTYYGYRNLRDYVSVRELDLHSMEFFGSYRMVIDGGDGRGNDEDGLDMILSDLHSAICDLEEGGRGYTEADSIAWTERLDSEHAELLGAVNVTGWEHRIRVGLGDRFRGGVRLSRGRNSTGGFGLFSDIELGDLNDRFDIAKGFVSMENIGVVNQVVLGNYNISLGQGLMIDNSDELMYRSTYRTWGLYPDLTSTRQFGLMGGAVEMRAGPILGYGFYSNSIRDALRSIDGTPNILVMSTVRTTPYADVVKETTFGGYGFFDFGGYLPTGTALGLGGMRITYSDSLVPDWEAMDIPGDAQNWDCPEYDILAAGETSSFVSISAQTILDNVSLEGEFVRQDNEAQAMLARGRWQNDYFYLLGIWRHYDLGYSNPYNRGFTEQLRYDDTVFEKPYYLSDPLASQLAEWPTPKPEEGLYVESRFQVSRSITFTKVYLDIWRSIPWNFDNHRFQGEVEYRPDFPIRFRLKCKYQEKTKMHDVIPTTSRTTEYTFRTFFLPSNSDYFDVQLRYGMVELTPNPLYGDDRLMTGGYIAVRWEHNFSQNLSVLGGSTLWSTNGMSQWEFEDTGIDFLDGDGTKFYVTIKNNLSDNLQFRLRILRKDTFYPRTGLYRPDPDDAFYYEGDPGSPVRDFCDHVTDYGIRCQMDFRW
ncbi:MAG: helix-hairpin-helix domain-containing protein [Candidatus Aegiribacteria sp.]|nr:helix-hairpin-helix domain-containing protein [Candidatus Aegiribacteria sp.]